MVRSKLTTSPALNESVVDLSESNAVVLMDSTVPVSVGLPVPAKVAVPLSAPARTASQPGEASTVVGKNNPSAKRSADADNLQRNIVPAPKRNGYGPDPLSPEVT